MHQPIAASIAAMAFMWSVIGNAAPHQPHQADMDAAAREHWEAPPDEASRQNPIVPDSMSIERGKQFFQTHCTGCHGPSGLGDGPVAAALTPKPANLVTMGPHHSDGDLAWKIAEGRNSMPGWRGALKAEDVWDLVNYIRSLGRE